VLLPVAVLLVLLAVAGATGVVTEAGEANGHVLFAQPEVRDIGDRFYVAERRPLGQWVMTSWQHSPFTAEGKFVPVGWDPGPKTGLSIAGPRRNAQRGMQDAAGTTTGQMHGPAVGAYLNSADLSVEGRNEQGRPLPGSGGYKMMITPQILFAPDSIIRPFRRRDSRLDLRLELQVPTAACAERKGSLAYVSAVLLLIDPQTRLRISYITGLFSKRSRMAPSTAIEHIAHDGPSRSWMIQCNVVRDHPWLDLHPHSASYQTAPWRGWRRFSWSIRREHVAAALAALRRQQPEAEASTDPADYQLRSFHLNAEIKYEAAPAEMGWSMRRARIVHAA
jgi:hypothetical protein